LTLAAVVNWQLERPRLDSFDVWVILDASRAAAGSRARRQWDMIGIVVHRGMRADTPRNR
jgi:hypothetical protein